LIYLHATRERDETIAAGMGRVLRDTRKKGNGKNRSGTQRHAGTSGHPEDYDLIDDHASGLGTGGGAGEGNRTRMTSLEGVQQPAVMRPELATPMFSSARY
jgi:hypothetical protein